MFAGFSAFMLSKMGIYMFVNSFFIFNNFTNFDIVFLCIITNYIFSLPYYMLPIIPCFIK